jgi:hypothetical protein
MPLDDLAVQVPCSACDAPAEFQTPHGPFCREHMIEEIEADDDLWMPIKLELLSHPPRVG